MQKPDRISDGVWSAWLKWDRISEMGDDPGDWMPWFECWLAGWAMGVAAADPGP